jgi:hypothetical protein
VILRRSSILPSAKKPLASASPNKPVKKTANLGANEVEKNIEDSVPEGKNDKAVGKSKPSASFLPPVFSKKPVVMLPQGSMLLMRQMRTNRS